MNVKLRGMYGSMQRMQELQSRIDALSPRNNRVTNDKLSEPTPNPSVSQQKEFSEFLDSDLKPLNPKGPEMSISLLRAPSDLLPMIRDAAQKAGIDPALFEALIGRESSFQPGAISIAGAKGLAQLMRPTADALGVKNIFDPEQNLNAGARYLAQMLKMFDNDIELALGAYNAGPGTVRQVGRVPRESLQYVKDVIKMAKEIRGD